MISDPQSLYQLPEGTILKDRYQIDSVLGKGGFGITYKGTDRMLELTVAVKEFFPHGYAIRSIASSTEVTFSTGQEVYDKWRERFLAEARILAKCNNVPAIVQVRDFFEENNTAYIVMEYLSGISLRDYLMRNGAVPVQKMFSYMLPLIRDLEQVHSLGLIHRDISPDNIMLMPDDTLKLFDFGAARTYSDEGARTMSIMLKPGYAPEEQYRKKGEQGPWTDVYGICATIYKCITGVTPPDSLERINGEELVAPSELGCRISPGLEQVLLKGMSIHGENRFRDAASLAAQIEACLEDPVSLDPEITVTQTMAEAEEESSYSQLFLKDHPVKDSGKDPGKNSGSRSPEPDSGTAPAGQIRKKKPKFILVAAIIIIAVVAVSPIAIFIRENLQTLVARDAESYLLSELQKAADARSETVIPENYHMTDGIYEPISDDALLDSVFWGIHSYAGEDFTVSNKIFTNIETDRGSLNVSEYPIAFLVNPAWDKEPLICLCFTDQFNYLYFVYGTYETEGGVLKVSEPANPESVPVFQPSDIMDYAPALSEGNYICKEGTSWPSEGSAYILNDTITLFWKMDQTVTGKIRLKNEDKNIDGIKYQSGYFREKTSGHKFLHLQGNASDPDNLYEDMEGLDLLYDPDRNDTSAVISFSDGGRTLDTAVTYYYEGFNSINLKTSKVERLYNGRNEVFDIDSLLQFDFINTWPYGFIIHRKLKDGDHFYYYQMPDGQTDS